LITNSEKRKKGGGAEKGEPQLRNKRGRLTTLRVSNEAENGEPQPQNKRGDYFKGVEKYMNSKRLRFKLSCLVVALFFLLPSFVTPAFAAPATPLQFAVEGIADEEVDEMAIDPQSWGLPRDQTWNDFEPNPVVNWMEELDPNSLINPTSAGAGQPIAIRGGLVLVDYLDRKFITGQPKGSDVLGYYMYNNDGSGYNHDAGIVRNPVNSILDFPDKYPGGYDDLTKFWTDYLNDPTFPLNNGVSIDAYWRENAYGKWAVDLEAYGAYTIPYFEFEMISSYQSYRDVPPSFRYAVPTASGGSIPGSGNTRSNDFDSHAATVSRVGAADDDSLASIYTDIRDVKSQYGITEFGGLNRSVAAPFNDFDFFFFLHAGYCESGTWQAFGQLQAASRADLANITYINDDGSEWKDPLGPTGRLQKVEAFFNENPEWIPVYEMRYRNGWGNSTGAWNANQYSGADALATINDVYRQTAFWTEALHDYRVAFDPSYAQYDPNAKNTWEFKLPQEDWDWASGYHAESDYVGRTQQRNTRYVSFTSWEGCVGEWSHQTSASFGTGFGQLGVRTGNSPSRLPYSTQGENSGIATFAHEFGHVSGWPDNYGNPWANGYSCDTENWDIMSRGSFAGPFGDLARWSVPGAEAGSVPVHAMQAIKTNGAGGYSWYDPGDTIVMGVQDLASSYPIVATIVPRNVPLDYVGATYSYNFGVPRMIGNNNTNVGFVKGIQLNFGSGAWAEQQPTKGTGFTNNFVNTRSRALRYGIEVVQQTGYDSYAHDTGVLMSRTTNTSNAARSVIDSHSYDIDMVDFFLNPMNQPNTRVGQWSRYVLAHATQQADALFKAGKSYTDTGFYGSIRNIVDGNNTRIFPTTFVEGHHDVMGANGAVLIPGSVRQGEDPVQVLDGVEYKRPIVSGDTVNEWKDDYNRMHYYILGRNDVDSNYGSFATYEVGVRHFDGLPVGGDLFIEEGAPIVPAKIGAYTKQTYTITHTGEATDIIRVTLEGDLAEGRVRTIKVPWEGGLQASVAEAGTSFTFNPNARDIYIDREVPTFFSEQNAVLLNDLYSIGPGESIEIEVWVKTTTGNAEDFDLTVNVSSETNPGKTASAGLTVLAKATTSAKNFISIAETSKNSRVWLLTFSVEETYQDGSTQTVYYTIEINANNANVDGKYNLGNYTLVYDIKGNGSNIKDFRIVPN